MIRVLLLPVAFVASVSFIEKTQELARCEIRALKVYPKFLDAPTGQPLETIQLCMKAAGYDWVGVNGPGCDPSHIMMGKPDIHNVGARCFAPMAK